MHMGSEKESVWVGFDLGGTKMLATVFDGQFNSLGRRRRRTKGHEGVENGLKRIFDTIRQALDEAGVEASDVAGIGVGVPAPVDLEEGVILEAANLGWENVALREALTEEFGCPAAVLNDVDAGVFGENRFGAARKARSVIGIFPGTGIGGGCVYEDRILHGHGISCLEIGHVQVQADGRLCGCGRYGCLETVASRLAIAAEAAMAAYRGEAPHLMEQTGTRLIDIRSGALAEAIEAGDKAVERIVRRAAEQIGIAVANVVHLMAPDVIVLGGGLVEAMPDLYVKTVSKTAEQRVMDAYRGTFNVVAAELGDNASVLGAAAWVRKVAEEAAPVS